MMQDTVLSENRLAAEVRPEGSLRIVGRTKSIKARFQKEWMFATLATTPHA
jgi:hypothetical protein